MYKTNTIRHALRKTAIIEIVSQTIKERDKKFLDIGFGDGSICIDLAKMGFKGEGIDFSDFSVKNAKQNLSSESKTTQKNIRFLKIDFLSNRYKNKNFDFIICSEVLEHVENDLVFLNKIYKSLKKSGLLVLTVPAHKKMFSEEDKSVGHIRRYNKKELLDKLFEIGFAEIKIYSYGYPITNITRYLVKMFFSDKLSRIKNGNNQQKTKKSAFNSKIYEISHFLHFFLKPEIIYPLHLVQKLFYKSDLGTGYIAMCRK